MAELTREQRIARRRAEYDEHYPDGPVAAELEWIEQERKFAEEDAAEAERLAGHDPAPRRRFIPGRGFRRPRPPSPSPATNEHGGAVE